jgi:hypothetical protein
MTEEIILDLEKYGQVIISSTQQVVDSTSSQGSGDRLVDASIADSAKELSEYIKVQFDKVLKLPLTGLGKLFLATLPNEMENELYELDEFNIGFEFGLSTEGGIDAGAVIKIVPNGNFNCSYKWKRKVSKDDKV